MHADPSILVTERLAIHVLGPRHLDAFVAYRNDPETAEMQGWSVPYELEAGGRFVGTNARATAFSSGSWTQFAIERLGTGELVGDMGVRISDDRATARIGYTLAPEHRGLGYATEAVTDVVTHLVGPLGCQRVIACTDARNVASIRVLQRAGFQPSAGERDESDGGDAGDAGDERCFEYLDPSIDAIDNR